MSCNGNSKETCGGPNGLSVFQFSGWNSVGCWIDNVNGRTLSHGMAVTGGASNMSVENCIAVCGKAGYTLAGVE